MPVAPVAVPAHIQQALTRASDRNGVDFGYLLQTAMRESSLNPAAKAPTSSATGLFQFIESTWLEVLKEEGPRLGYGDIAAKITSDGQGNYSVTNPRDEAGIMALRKDAAMSADLAAAFTVRNGEYLKERFGRMPSPGELYIAHFFGARGAGAFFDAGLNTPEAVAADLFPKQAAANRRIFFDGTEPLSIREVYQNLVAKHAGGTTPARQAPAGAAFAAQQIASQDAFRASEPVLDPALAFRTLYDPQAAAGAGPVSPQAATLGPVAGTSGPTGVPNQPHEDGTPSAADFERFFARYSE